MAMTPADIIAHHMRSGSTGLLSMKVTGQEFLLKVYLHAGSIVCASLGAGKDAVCRDVIMTGGMADHFFMENVAAKSSAPSPAAIELNNLLKAHPAPGALPVSLALKTQHGSASGIPAGALKTVEEMFTSIMGPIGRIIVENAYRATPTAEGGGMGAREYGVFVSVLAGELPDGERDGFLSACERLKLPQ